MMMTSRKSARRSILIASLAFVVLGAGAAAGARAESKAARPSSVPRIAFEKFTLANGLQVILHVDRKLPIVHVNEWFHVGSGDEKPGRTGFAHLFEHIMFQGSKNATGEYFSHAERAGANLFERGVNGTTDTDRTNFFITVPSSNLEYVLWLESDRVATLADALTQEKLDEQREVVRNEIREGEENQPYGRAFRLITENLHPKGHPYSWNVSGSHEDLVAATLDEVKDFFRKYYVPNNLSLVIAGDFDPAEARRLVEKYFASLPPGPPLDRQERWIPRLDGEKVVEARDRVPQERTYMVWPAPPFFTPGDADLDLASTILADGLSSRLSKILVYEKQLCSDVSAFNFSREISSAFIVQATARPGASLAEIEAVVTAELNRLARQGPTAAELARAQTKWEYGFVSGLERIGGFGGKSDRLNMYNTYLGDPGRFEADFERYVKVTPAAIREVVGKWLDTPDRLLVHFRPETAGRAEAGQALDRSVAPALAADRPFRAPQVRSGRLDNGLEVLVVERPELPKVAVRLATRAGSIADPAGKEGVASLTMRTIDLGTRTRKALEIEDAFGDLGTGLQGSAERESGLISLEVLKRNLEPALVILADVVENATFPESEVERARKLALDDLSQEENDPNALAERIAPMLAFGPDHPYGRPEHGLAATVRAITRDDLVRFHSTYWKPGGSALVFAGDVTLEQAMGFARTAFGGWAGGAPPAVVIPEPRPVGPGKVYLVDRQDAAQTVIAEILPGPKRKVEDYYAFRLADAVWGGAFQSRLNLNLREEKHYSYGVFSFPLVLTAAGGWMASGGVQTDKTAEAVAEFAKEVRAIAGERPIADEELAAARANRVRGYAQRFESLGRVAERVAVLWSFGLPMTELQRECDETEKATLAAVNAAAQKYAVPERSTILLVGDRGRIEDGVRKLGLGEIVPLGVEGEPVASN